MIPHAVYQADGSAILRIPYNRNLIEALKLKVDSSFRSWDPIAKAWTVQPGWVEAALDLLRATFGQVEIAGEPLRPRPIRPTNRPYAELHLRPSAPPAVVEAAYKALARDRHPDRLPAHERARAHEAMVAINAAYAALRTEGVA